MIDTPRYKELQEQLALQTDEKGRIDTRLNMGEEIKNFDVDEAMEIADEVVTRSRTISYLPGTGRGLCLKGFCYRLKGEYDAGLEVLKNALAIAKAIPDHNIEATSLYYLGNIYRDLGDLANGLSHYENALSINVESGNEYTQSIILASISNVLFDLNDYESALEYALKCLPIFERVENVNSLLNIYNTLGNIYFKMEKFNEALQYFDENLARSERSTAAFVMAESGLGKVYYKMQNFEAAQKYLSEALEQAKELGNAEVQIICEFYLGRLYMDEGSYRQALQYLNAAFTLAGDYSRRHDIMSIHEMLAVLYDKMGDIPKAFFHLKSFERLKEEIFQQTTLSKLKNLQVRQQTELAKKEKEVAERTAALKHQFMANMSHEIRTPMNAIVGMTRLLLAKDPKPEQMRYLKAIQLSADNLLVIINDILDLSKIEAGKIIIEHVDFSVREVVQSVRDMLMLKAEDKHIGLRTSVEDAVPRKLIGDPTRLNQILINLAGNAVKFTEKGHVDVNVTVQKREGAKYWLKLDVTDTGIGIAPEYVDTIFDSFTQAGADVTRKFGGTGLGLTISKQLATLMGGDINVTSTLGTGTTFTTVIPFEESSTQEDVKPVSVIDNAAIQKLKRLKVLLVEDNEFNRMVAEDTLKEVVPGITVHMAENGKVAIDKLKNEMYDILLMDIQMPVMDGMEATRIIRTTLPEPARSVKIIAMTANVMQEEVQKYFEIGMNAYVSKPFNSDELLLKMDAISESITPAAKKEEPKPAAPQPTPAPVATVKDERKFPPLPAQVTDMTFLKSFTGGKSDKMQKYIGMFLENAPKLLDSIDRAMPIKDFPTIKIAAHSLKPQLSYMGVKEDVSNIFLIEQSAGEAAHQETLQPLIVNLKRVCDKAFEELRKQ